ncbi:MAG: FprA family A-type flavoprotein, partial [Methanomicrobiales archaeon]|nr:FprA family A-type flavoprotein [Methanomicrobiales archaeon]
LPVTDIGNLAKALVDAATVVIGAPTLLFGPHPQVVYAAYLANLLRPKARYATVIGSYGWGGKTVDTLKDMLGRLKVEFIEPVYIKGYPKEEDFRALDRLADEIRKKHEEAGVVVS